MKRKKILSLLLFTYLNCSANDQNSAENITHQEYSIPTEKTHLYVTIDNRHKIKNFQDHHGQMSAQSHASSSSTASVQSFFKLVQEQCNQQTFNSAKEHATQKFITARDVAIAYAKEQKFNIPLVLGAASYACIFYTLMRHSYYLVSHDTWSCWKDTIPLDMLKILPEQELGKELVFAAQEKYQKADTLTDLLTPLIFFLKDIDYELYRLQKFMWLYSWLKKLHLFYFFPISDKLASCAERKYNRLLFLKNIFIRWVTDYKLALEKKNYEAS